MDAKEVDAKVGTKVYAKLHAKVDATRNVKISTIIDAGLNA